MYELLELSKDPETVVQVLTKGSDLEELEVVRDALQADSFRTKGPGSMTKQRFAVRPALEAGQRYGFHFEKKNGKMVEVPTVKFRA
jgi:hypothetical protein